jgi:hypothetical protein
MLGYLDNNGLIPIRRIDCQFPGYVLVSYQQVALPGTQDRNLDFVSLAGCHGHHLGIFGSPFGTEFN